MNKIYQWDKAPSWAKYAARDSNGFAHWFESLPYPFMENPHVLEWSIDRVYRIDGSCDPFWNNDCPDSLLSLESRFDNLDSKDPLSIYIGAEILVIRPIKGNVRISIFKNKIDDTFSFINLTKKHICACRFKSIKEAFEDLSLYVQNGDISFYKIDLS